jgi:hypothetical protein
MSKIVELDTFLLTLKVPRDLPAATVSKIRRVLNRPAFQARLRQTVEALLRRYPTLHTVALSVSR